MGSHASNSSATLTEDVSLLNFFIDHDVIPIEINFDRDQSHTDLLKIFESIKSKIGSPRNYGLSQKELDEIQRIKQEIAKQEALEKVQEEKQKFEETRKEEENKLKEWVRLKVLHQFSWEFSKFSYSPRPIK